MPYLLNEVCDLCRALAHLSGIVLAHGKFYIHVVELLRIEVTFDIPALSFREAVRALDWDCRHLHSSSS